MDKIAIVILNWNGQHFLERFLPSVLSHSQEATVYVADNGSTDNSIDFIKGKYPQVKIIELPENNGFCQGYNKALLQVQAEYYVILNSDIEVSANWLSAPITLLDNDINIAACQPKIKSYNNKELFEHAGAAGGFIDFLGFPFCRGRIFLDVEKDHTQYDDNIDIFWATGAALIIRAQAFKSAGGFDPDFFAHMEEIDLCWRLKNQGYRIAYCGKSEVYHVGGGTLPPSNPKKTFLNFRNGLALLLKNLPLRLLFPLIFIRMLLDAAAALQFLLKGFPKDAFAIFLAHMSFYRYSLTWYRRRNIIPKALPSQMIKQSIVWRYFVLKQKTFDEVTEKKRNSNL